MNRLLKRQIKRVYGKDFDPDTLDEKFKLLLDRVEEAYDENDKEKRLLEHTININTDELTEAYKTIEKNNLTLKFEKDEQSAILQQYRDAIDDTLIVSKTDRTGIITYVNELFCKISGYKESELIGRPHSIVKFPTQPKALYTDLWNTITNKQIWRGVLKNARKDGSAYYVDATIFPLISQTGEILEYIAFRNDITARIESEKKLDRQRRYSHTLFDNQENIVITANDEEGVLQANKMFFDTFGFESLAAFKAKHSCICELFIEREGYLKPSTTDMYWAQEILHNSHQQHKALMRDRDHKLRIFSVTLNTVEFDSEHFVIANFTDITELEHAREIAVESEKAKANFMANMSHEIRTPMNGIVGFTQLLTQGELNTKQRRYISLIEHSTNTLLDIINDILDFSKIESGKLDLDLSATNPFIELRSAITIFDAKAKEKNIILTNHIDTLIKECLMMDQLRVTQILTNLINNAIKFTPEDGEIKVNIKKCESSAEHECLEFSVTDTGVGIPASRLASIFQPFTQADSSTTRSFGGTGLGLSISSSLCQLMGSKLEVESVEGKGSRFFFTLILDHCKPSQILASTIHNPPLYIIKYSSKIYVDVIYQLNHFGIEFVPVNYEDITDDILQDHIVVLFDSRQVEKVQKSSSSIIMIDDSDAASERADRDGSLYHIGSYETCPSILYNAIVELNLLPSEKVNKEVFYETIDIKLLVAEDYDVNQMLIDEMLKSFDISATYVTNGREAVEAVEQEHFDLILMDINMPELNGIDATIELRKKGQLLPIVALTANALEGDRERFMGFGMDDYLSKPIDFDALKAVLIKYSKAGLSSNNAMIDADKPKQEQISIQEKPMSDVIASSIVALENAKKRMRFSDAIILKLFGKFVSSVSQSAQALHEANERGDKAALSAEAHSIKGIALNLQFNPLGERVAALEKAAKAEDDSYDYTGEIKAIIEEITLIREHQDQIIQKMQNS